jgi:2,3-dimethylmalate lyase
MQRTTMMRKLLQDNQLLVTAGVYDALSAKLVEHAGFNYALLSGFGFEASLLGKPDVGLLTMSEIVNHARNIAAAVDIPVLADAEAGYGGPANIQRTIREFERAGVAGVFIEDQVHPVFCGTLKKFKKIISQEEMVWKIKCALEAREDPDFIIGARTDSDIVSIDEQIKRCNAYAEAGADLVTALPETREEFQAVADNVKAPLWLYLSALSELTPKDIEEMGIRGLLVYPVEPLFVAVQGMMELLKELKTKGTIKETFEKMQVLNYKEFFSFINLRSFIELDNKFPFLKGKAD